MNYPQHKSFTILNELLKEQVQNFLKIKESLPLELEVFLQVVSNTYDIYQNEILLREKPISENSEALKELTIKFRSEAEELKKSHDELGRILNSVNHGFFSRDISTDNYTYLSLACERIYGYTAKEFIENSRLWYDVIYYEDRPVVERDNERLNNKEEVYTQYRIIHKDTSIRWIELTIIPFFKNNKLSRVDGVVNDITKRKEAETEREVMLKELIKSNADLKQFSYITSHNLRSPLSNIQGILNLFDFDEKDSHNLKCVDMLRASTQQLNSTIGDLTRILIIKNNINPAPAYYDLEIAFLKVIQTFRNELIEIGGEVFTDFKSPGVMINKVYLESVFINLISNSIKYHSPDRRLIIQVESFDDGNNYVKIKFSDNGLGIDLKRHKDKIFGLYQRFHPDVEGQGLGLFIVKSQIEATGGEIAIESEPEVGTTFLLTFKKN